jgi:arylsulfatase A-like enzyme
MPKHGYFSPYRCPTLSDGPTGEYLTDRLTDEAIRLIRRHDGSPFFLNFCHYAVHIPIQVKEAERGRFAERARELGLEELKTFEEGPAFPCEHKKDQRIVRRLLQSDPAYAAMMWNLDQNVGRLLAAVDEAGLRENTLVVFTSDNGGLATAEGSPTCNLPLAEGKGWMYEGGTRVPLLIRWPAAVRPGRVCDAPLTSPDFYPTFLELAGLDPLPKQHCDGRSFAAVLRGAEQFGRGPLFWHYPHYGNQGGTPGASVRDGDHILLEFYEDNRAELYNLREDEGERRNLAEQRPDLVRDLRTRLTEWRTQVNAVLPSPNPDCQPW